MDKSSVLNLIKSLSSLCKEGISEWNGCILSKEISSLKLNSSVPSASKTQLVDSIFANTTNIETAQIQTYMWKPTHRKTSSISQTPTSIGSNGQGDFSECFDGSPLPLEDHLGDMLLVDSMDAAHETVLFDQACLVPDDIFSYMMSCLCTAITSHNLDDVTDWKMLLESIFPMVVFWETLNLGDDRNGMILVECLSDMAGKLSRFSVKRVQIVGLFPYNMWHGGTRHSNTINFLKNKHLNLIENISASTTVKMKSYAQFERLQTNESVELSSSFAAVSVACDQVKEILGTDSKSISEVKVHIAPVPGDKESPTFALYQDISKLIELFDMLKNQSSVDGSANSQYQGKETSTDEVVAFLASYNQEWSVWRDTKTEDKKDSTSEEYSLTKQMVQERKELDFTERAWEVLKKLESAEDIGESIDMIYKKIEEGRNTQLWLHSNNQTTISKVVRDSYTGAVTKRPRMNDVTAVMLTIELGLDKMYRDYRGFFIGNRITVGSCLDAYKDTPASLNTDENLSKYLREQFIMVQKLHHIMEFVIQCKALLSLSDDVIFSKAGRILRDYMTQDLDFKKKFDFDVDFTEVKTMIVDRPPTIWKLILNSNEGKQKRSTCGSWLPEYPFRGILSPPMNVNESHEVSQNSKVDEMLQYYVSIQTTYHLNFDPLQSLSNNEFKWIQNM